MSYSRRLLYFDAAVVVFVTGVTFAVMVAFDRIDEQSAPAYALLSAAIAVCWMLALSLSRSRDFRLVGVGFDEYRRAFIATCVVYGATAVGAALAQLIVPRSYFVVGLPLGILALIIERNLNRMWLAKRRQKGLYLTKVVVVGEPNDVQYVIDQISRRPGRVEYDIVGAVLPVGDASTSVTGHGNTVPVIGFANAVPSVIARVGATAVIVAGRLDGGSAFVRELGWQLETTSTELVLAPGLTNVAGPRIHWRPVDGLPLMHVEMPHYNGLKHVAKRAMDVVLASLALLVIAPVLAVIALLIKHGDHGPVFFTQKRMGRGGVPFTMIKFRTMCLDAEAKKAELEHLNEGAGAMFKLAHDPRITTVGHRLRHYSLDELPQFINVLRGDMSLVGPRPWPEKDIPTGDRMVIRRLYSKPGITGLWQTAGRSDLDWEESVRLDLFYVENWSITGDVALLCRTAKQLLHPSGAY
ncbi:polyprenyl glycosylphosphotransferase [Subtercola lobariae]|uniref:Polyprenyl glycosylphosphotransferase n=1 Tax=Subtercola lobariae TaxID=1588641 RepID=A0A917ETK9_9MICO|nr:polyprenyl glycosylphosphotransferase [Subtercola lobariae]